MGLDEVLELRKVWADIVIVRRSVRERDQRAGTKQVLKGFALRDEHWQ
jgi:hypothetical protein